MKALGSPRAFFYAVDCFSTIGVKMEESRFPVSRGGLDHDRKEAEREGQRRLDAIREAKKLSVDDYVKRLKEIQHGMY